MGLGVNGMLRKSILTLATLGALQPVVYARADDKNSVPLPRDQWPVSVVFDVPSEKCDAMGGTLNAARGPKTCYIPPAKCETIAGFKVVMRDYYTSGSGRLAACRKMQ
jgi:hypothetical protein